jgi:hypothetical protein
MSPDTPAVEVIAALDLQPHPEGGWFKETHRDGGSTAIFYLLEQGQVSAWHRVRNASEVWHHYAGHPLTLSVAEPDQEPVIRVLGPDLVAGQTPQVVVPVGWWQSAEPLGGWTLVGCTVAPPFQFSEFEMAPEGWAPPG